VDVFEFRQRVIADYERFSRSFSKIRADDIAQFVDAEYRAEKFWPAPLVQLNPNFVPGSTIEDLVDAGLLHEECRRIFRADKTPHDIGKAIRLHKHQEDAIRAAQRGESYVLTTGTGSGKSLAYFIPIVQDILRRRSQGDPCQGISAIVIYPMNALCNSQLEELQKFLTHGYGVGKEPVTYARYTGQESTEERQKLAENPPDILLTNYVMLELIMTRQDFPDPQVVAHAQGLRFLVLDELHTYRGRQGADVAMLVRRVRERLNLHLLCVGTSATMASEGTVEDRNTAVATIATRLFGVRVRPTNVITETLERVTPEEVLTDGVTLAAALRAGLPETPSYETLRQHPVAAWIETRLGLEREDGAPEGKLIRMSKPRTLRQAAAMLAEETGLDVCACETYLAQFLLLAYHTRSPSTGRSLLAFRLHQFIAGAGDLYGTLEPPGVRYLTVNGQQFKPGERDKTLFTLCFCRDCGQEYHPVWATMAAGQPVRFEARELTERSHEDDDVLFGYFMPDMAGSFDAADIENGLYPEDWIDFGATPPRLKANYRRYRPRPLSVAPDGAIGAGVAGWFIPGTFRFCLQCGIAYDGAVRSDLTKLSSLSSEGRSSATTVLTVSSLRYLLNEAVTLDPKAKKLLGFTDNRQDASLQAGHFNDFIQILLLRGALLAAIRNEPATVLKDDVLTQRVQTHLHLDVADFSANPEARGPRARNAEAALRDVLGYRLYYDLQRGWRITNPNLEQLQLLQITYDSLDLCCQDAEAWHACPPLLAQAAPEQRLALAHELLDVMRRNLCIKTIYLDAHYQEQIRNRSFAMLKEPWALTEDEKMFAAPVMVPRPKTQTQDADFYTVNVSYRSKFGRQMRRQTTWGDSNPHYSARFTEDHYNTVVDAMLGVLHIYGLIEASDLGRGLTGYRLDASVIEWHAGDPAKAEKANAFFRSLYENVAAMLSAGETFLHQLEAREHTAQVDSEMREHREQSFRDARLPVLFCSPTMELGVDIAQLNTVYMRNVPPTAANYAQRSGRAGRSGQPALVVTYCAAKSPHDQYFFQDPTRMVAGVVNAPTIDLANEELLTSHLHAVWLAETGQKLQPSIKDLLDLAREEGLPVREELAEALESRAPRERAAIRARAILSLLQDELRPEVAPWYSGTWLDSVISGAFLHFEQAFDRWRSLFRATTRQMKDAHAIEMNHAIGERERREAKQRYDEARIQHDLLLESSRTFNSDFYTYRYLASQGFLPGYNFPRLPLMAFLPARREKIGRDGFLSRPRFLGLSEFGPQSIIYHEGSTYRVRKAILGVRDEESVTTAAKLPVRSARLCPACGYAHFDEDKDCERCVNCDALLDGGRSLLTLYRIEQVSTRRATRITSDEEERQRQGYEMMTTIRFAQADGRVQCLATQYSEGGEELLDVRYGPAATLWRVNLGWRRRKEKSIYGFNIDVTTGEWSKDQQAPEDADDDMAHEARVVQRIIPFVEDRKNCLMVHPKVPLDAEARATFQYALKRGIETAFQLESSELAAEALPDLEHRNAILLYESAEGGAGVLTRLASDLHSLQMVVRRALEVCHYTSVSGAWTDHTDLTNLDEDCEAGCYKCLLSYTNQPDHKTIDRRNPAVLDLLCRLSRADGTRGALGKTSEELFEVLANVSLSLLEQAWLGHVREHAYHLPDKAQPLLEDYGTRPDFAYAAIPALVYIDGPHHETDHQRQLDRQMVERLEDAGYTVIRFPKEQEAWPAIFEKYAFVFGTST
jgi:superfamily II DNA/RNA helicase